MERSHSKHQAANQSRPQLSKFMNTEVGNNGGHHSTKRAAAMEKSVALGLAESALNRMVGREIEAPVIVRPTAADAATQEETVSLTCKPYFVD